MPDSHYRLSINDTSGYPFLLFNPLEPAIAYTVLAIPYGIGYAEYEITEKSNLILHIIGNHTKSAISNSNLER